MLQKYISVDRTVENSKGFRKPRKNEVCRLGDPASGPLSDGSDANSFQLRPPPPPNPFESR